jgi:hypothetical protein
MTLLVGKLILLTRIFTETSLRANNSKHYRYRSEFGN